MTYSYDPTKIKARGKDQMRFELGDTQTDGGADTCALADEEYEAVLAGLKAGKKAWLYAKTGRPGGDPVQDELPGGHPHRRPAIRLRRPGGAVAEDV